MRSEWTHKDLDVWQRALVLAEETYRVTARFPIEERYGLSAQMRRAAVSVLSNIAEGAARKTRPDFLNFLHIARGSLAELDAQVLLVTRLGLAQDTSFLAHEIQRVGQLLGGLIRRLRRTPKAQSSDH